MDASALSSALGTLLANPASQSSPKLLHTVWSYYYAQAKASPTPWCSAECVGKCPDWRDVYHEFQMA